MASNLIGTLDPPTERDAVKRIRFFGAMKKFLPSIIFGSTSIFCFTLWFISMELRVYAAMQEAQKARAEMATLHIAATRQELDAAAERNRRYYAAGFEELKTEMHRLLQPTPKKEK
jgi:hypothetical protein